MELMDHQKAVVDLLGSGKILYGGVGSGKSATVLAYYAKYETPRHIYVITTAKKRDSMDWEGEAAKFGISTEDHLTTHGIITVDSWNQIKHYEDIENAFFIFDEQRLVGYGAWVKSFLKIAKKNRWVLLSATPGDNWLDYAPVFIANGWYKNITEFKMKHVVYAAFSKYPKVQMYLNETKLEALRNDILVEMPYVKETERVLNYIEVGYDKAQFRRIYRDRWHVFEDRPLRDAGEMFRVMRRLVNSHQSRLDMIHYLMNSHPRMVIFYNFDFELEILRSLYQVTHVGEWNGHRKTEVPDADEWVYLVQYVAGAEGWNCTTTNAVVLYSLTYSYKVFEQAQGRIDRLDTTYKTLYYYIFVSNSVIDRSIRGSLKDKKNFNRRKFIETLPISSRNDEEYHEGCQI